VERRAKARNHNRVRSVGRCANRKQAFSQQLVTEGMLACPLRLVENCVTNTRWQSRCASIHVGFERYLETDGSQIETRGVGVGIVITHNRRVGRWRESGFV